MNIQEVDDWIQGNYPKRELRRGYSVNLIAALLGSLFGGPTGLSVVIRVKER